MSTPDIASRSSHTLLRTVSIALAIGVLVLCALMWWWVAAPDIYDPVAVVAGHAASYAQPLAALAQALS
jgi:hypothetical protein